MLARTLRRDDGFSLTELMTVTLLMGVVLAAAYLLMGAVTGMADQIQARQVAADEGRQITDRLTREIRQAFEIRENQGAFESAQPRNCTFYADLDRNGVPEMVSYRVVGKTLYRRQALATSAMPPYTFGPWGTDEVVIESLDGGWNGNVFTYYDSQDPPAEVPSGQVARISAVSLRLVNTATVNRKSAVVDLSTWVKVRAVHNTID